LLAVIETATGVKPIIIGKPQPTVFMEAVRRLGGTLANTAMVGDRLTTDIAGGQGAGLHTILVLSGVTSREHVQSSTIKPDFIFDDITDLANHLVDNS
jgi:ribonucleotide monophosphatase NagD (HAD superfamily)